MPKEIIFAIISIIIYLIGVIPYWRDTYSWRTIPHFFSNIVWLILVGFNAFVLFSSKEYLWFAPALLMTMSLIYTTIYGYRWIKKIHINWFDYLCLILAIWAVVYWVLDRNTLNTVIITTIIDLIAFLPTFKKGWIQPWTETILLYFMGSINQIFTFLAIASPNAETSIFWLYLFFANLIFFFMVFFRRWYLQGWGSIFK